MQAFKLIAVLFLLLTRMFLRIAGNDVSRPLEDFKRGMDFRSDIESCTITDAKPTYSQ